MENDDMLLKFQEQVQVTNLQQESEDKEKRHSNLQKCYVKLQRLSITPVRVLETNSPIKSQQCEKRPSIKTKVCKKEEEKIISN